MRDEESEKKARGVSGFSLASLIAGVEGRDKEGRSVP